MTKQTIDMIVIGGSSGCIPPLVSIINSLPLSFMIPVVVIIHRMKNTQSNLHGIFTSEKQIREPEDKEPVMPGVIYLAPQNYHLLFEVNHTFCMDYSEPVHYSRPSIDVTFNSAAQVYKRGALGILLSGANQDGAAGLNRILQNGGRGFVQDPQSATYPTMPLAALRQENHPEKLSPEEIVQTLLTL
ncbi:MAG: chemotaxis protein CheB [Bacteroidia bacterium]|jgi:two-component system chemotaxis response regulator CheB